MKWAERFFMPAYVKSIPLRRVNNIHAVFDDFKYSNVYTPSHCSPRYVLRSIADLAYCVGI